MKFEKLSENKLRIILNLDDLADKHIDYHSFMANSTDTQNLFLDMLDKAEKEVGFVTKDYKIMIEALVTSNGEFIVTITRYLPNEFFSSTTKKKSLKVKRKYTTNTNHISIYAFNSFENYCLFCSSLNSTIIKNINKISKNISLYMLKNTYYLVIKNVNIELENSKLFYSLISEYANVIHKADIFEYKLKEYGNIIFENNAIKKCKKYFG